MSDLGCHALTDDQALDLLEELCVVLASRSHPVRNLAQGIIMTEGQKVKAARDACQRAQEQAVVRYRDQIYKDILPEVQAAVDDGRYVPVESTQEGQLVVEATRKALAEVEAKLRAQSPQGLVVSNINGYLSIRMGDTTITSRRPHSQAKIGEFIQRLFQALTA